MRIKLSIYVFITLLTVGTIFVFTTQDTEAGWFAIPPVCCVTPETNTCVGCDSGCATLPTYCARNGGEERGEFQICVDEGPGNAECVKTQVELTGCCVSAPGQCAEDLDKEQCLSDTDGKIWIVNQGCDAQPLCQTKNVPALSQWTLIGVALVLGIVGFIIVRRRQLTTNS